jgi:hypothetical protein
VSRGSYAQGQPSPQQQEVESEGEPHAHPEVALLPEELTEERQEQDAENHVEAFGAVPVGGPEVVAVREGCFVARQIEVSK